MIRQQLLHPLPLRIWHWVNTLITLALIVTGVRLMISGLFPLLDYRTAVLLHKAAGFAMAGSFLFWLSYSIISGSFKRYYFLRSRDFKGLPLQVHYYLFGVFEGVANPFPTTPVEKFNPLQKIAYLSTMLVLTPVVVGSGVLYSNILLFREVISQMGGLKILDALHLSAAYVFVIYLIVHLYMSTMGRTPFSHMLEMFTGREEQTEISPEEH